MRFKVPALIAVAPLKVLAVPMVTVPVPFMIRPPVPTMPVVFALERVYGRMELLNVVSPGLTLVVMFTAVVVGATGPAPRFTVSSNSTVSPAQKSVAAWAPSSAQSGVPLTDPVVPVFQVPAFAPDHAGLSPTTCRVRVLPL